MLKTVPGEDYKVSLDPAPQVAQCIDGVLVLFDTEQKGLTGVLVDNRKRACAAWARKPRSRCSDDRCGLIAGQARSHGTPLIQQGPVGAAREHRQSRCHPPRRLLRG
jgi:hypothetical protein